MAYPVGRTETRTADLLSLIFCLTCLCLTVLYPSARLLWRALTEWRGEMFASGAAFPGWFRFGLSAAVSFAGALMVRFALEFVFEFGASDTWRRWLGLPTTAGLATGLLAFYYLAGGAQWASGIEVVCNTAAIAFGSVLASGLVGTGLAVLLTRYSFPGRGALAVLAYLPFTLPPLVGVLSFYYLIGLDGFVPRLLERLTGTPGWSFEGPAAILLIHTYSFYVFFYAMVSSALESFDHSQVEAARTLGASRLRTFLQVTLPQLRPALLGASLLTFMSSGASFSAPLLFGHGFPVLSVRIYEHRTQFQDARAFTLTVVLALVSLAAVFLFRSAQRTRGSASKGVRTPLRSASGRMVAGAFSVACILLLLTPHLTIGWLSLVDHRQWFEELVPTTFTLANYTGLFQDSAHFTPIRNSLRMSSLAAIATLAVALPASYLIGRRRRGSRLVNLLVMIPWALPGTVIAMNLIVAFNDPWLPLYNTVWMLPLAYFVRGIPLLTRMITAAVEPFDAGLIEAGRTLGASRFFCLSRLVLPLLAPAIAAATALVFALSLGEFVASILLYVQANIPISMQIFMQMRGSGIGSAFAYSMFLMLLVAATFILARRFGSRAI